MSNRRKIQWATGAVLVLICIVTMPNLLRSRMSANEASLIAGSRPTPSEGQDVSSKLSLFLGSPTPEKKLIHNAELGLVVGNVRAAVDQIRRLTELNHGDIDRLEMIETGSGFLSGTIEVRVPAAGLETALEAFKNMAVRTEREQITIRDVTREFYDNEAHRRNLQAEEQQYLTIMKQAHTIKDTLEVSEKLSDVRDRIERLQAQIQVMTHDIEMSLVTVALIQESDTQVLGFRWRPLYNAKTAARELLVGLGEWLDWIVAVLIKLPLIALWVTTVGGILWAFWKIGRLIWLQFLMPKVAARTSVNAPDNVK